ncbi:MAG: phage integrase SAM-like domain-containing protein, partial [Flavobacteriaceae bacterium]
MLLSQLDTKTCRDFYSYLQTCVSHNGNKLSESAYKKYMKSFKQYLEQAIYNGIIIEGNSPAKVIKVGNPKPTKTRLFLEKHELEQLEQLDTKYVNLKNAYLFASYSAITKAELKVMKWGDFSQDK